MIEEPSINELPERRTAMIHLVIPRADMMEAFGPAVEELMGVLEEQGIEPAGSVFAHHLRMDPDTFDFELGVPVDEPVEAEGRVTSGLWRSGNAAQTVYHGPYEGLPDAWGEFQEWIERSGRPSASDVWESYVVGPNETSESAEWRTKLTRPLQE